MVPEFALLISRLDRAAVASTPLEVTRQVKDQLVAFLAGCRLPAGLRRMRIDSYARRLVHADAAGRYVLAAMTWAPGQRTAIHDHGGLWCVEGVVEGEVEVTNYTLRPAEHEFVVEAARTIRAQSGSAGALLPPTDHHVLANVSDKVAVTLHVYGGHLQRCRIYERNSNGHYRESVRDLSYDEQL